MTLQIPEIDGRTFDELLAEAKARIPVHNPEWVNFNDADPGITLLQLWAFMTENLLYQSQLIPERNRIRFLQLLGIEAEPAKAAQGIVAFENLKGRLEMVTLAPDLEVLAGQTPFRTVSGLTLAPVEARPYVKARIEEQPDFAEQYGLVFGSFLGADEEFDYYEARPVQWSAVGSDPVDLSTTVDGSLWMALLARSPAEVEATRELIGGQVITFGVVPGREADSKVLRAGGSDTTQAEPRLEYHVPNADEPLPSTAADRVAKYRKLQSRAETNLLIEPGVVQLQLPAASQLRMWDDLDPTESGVGRFPPALEGDAAERLVTWIRIRPAASVHEDGAAAGQSTATFSWVGANAAPVRQRARVVRESLGTGSGLPDQTFQLANVPVLVDSIELTIGGKTWTRVPDLMQAGPEVGQTNTSDTTDPRLVATAFQIERDSGLVTFGDGIHGARPAAKASIEATYDYGGGRAGLVGIGSISKAAFLPAGAKVHNPLPTWGADEAQSISAAEDSVAAFVRHRDRTVANQDFVDIAKGTPGVDIGRVEVLPLFHPDLPGVTSPGVVTLMLIPKYDTAEPDAPSPDQYFLSAVCEHIDPRRLITTEVHLRGPSYVPVWLSIGIDVMPGQAIGVVRERVKDAMRAFLSPLYGGHTGAGWPLATPVNRLEVLAVAARVDGVAKVFDVLLSDSGGAPSDQVPMQTSLHLPKLVAIDVRQGDPLPLADLQGDTVEKAAALPIPVIPEECC